MPVLRTFPSTFSRLTDKDFLELTAGTGKMADKEEEGEETPIQEPEKPKMAIRIEPPEYIAIQRSLIPFFEDITDEQRDRCGTHISFLLPRLENLTSARDFFCGSY
jgi:hypothetical protein